MDKATLFLQNALAQAAGLLHQAGELLTSEGKACLLQIEITAFMLETRKSLSSLLAQPSPGATSKESVQSAPTAERIGQNWTSPLQMKGMNMSSQDGPAEDAGIPISPPEASGSCSAGGTMEPTQDPNALLEPFPWIFSNKSYLPRPPKSSEFLSLTYHTGQRLLVAKKAITSIIEMEAPQVGCTIFYNENTRDGDHVLEPIEDILKGLSE